MNHVTPGSPDEPVSAGASHEDVPERARPEAAECQEGGDTAEQNSPREPADDGYEPV